MGEMGRLSARLDVVPGVTRAAGRSAVHRLSDSPTDFDADALAYFAAMPVQPSVGRKNLINALILSLKSSGWWSVFDWFCILSAHDAGAYPINAKVPSKSLTIVGSPTFTTDRGVAPSTTAYLSLGQPFVFSGSNMAQNSGVIGAYVNSAGAAAGYLLGDQYGSTGIQTATATGFKGSIHGNALATSSSVGRVGHFTVTRPSSATIYLHKNGTQVLSFSDSSISPSPNNGLIGRFNAGGSAYTDDRIAIIYSGADTGAPSVSSLDAAVVAFLAAIGAQ